MNAFVADFSAPSAIASTRVERFIRETSFDRPTLVVDRQAVADQFRALRAGLGRASIHYAVKANPAREIIETLVAHGSHFDAASRGEIELCLSQGAAPERASDIAWAHQVGITLFSVDAEEEIELMAEPGRGMVAEAGAIAAEVLLVS